MDLYFTVDLRNAKINLKRKMLFNSENAVKISEEKKILLFFCTTHF